MSVQPAQPNRNKSHNPRVAPIPAPSKKRSKQLSRSAEHHFSPKPITLRGLSPTRATLATVAFSMLFFTVFGEDAINQANRKHKRLNGAQIEDHLIAVRHLSRPMLWTTHEPATQAEAALGPNATIQSLTTVSELLAHMDALPSE
ncbi:MAG: hypothetical protein VYA72_06875 [Bacteroidota bacterium]|nr:hypothetical protein [Bacteroidota bacterium]